LRLYSSDPRFNNEYWFHTRWRLLITDTQARLSFCKIIARMIIHAATSPQGCYLRV